MGVLSRNSLVDEFFQSWHKSPPSRPVEFAVRVAGCFPTQGGGSVTETVRTSHGRPQMSGRCGHGDS
jgi:hypothetical protein